MNQIAIVSMHSSHAGHVPASSAQDQTRQALQQCIGVDPPNFRGDTHEGL